MSVWAFFSPSGVVNPLDMHALLVGCDAPVVFSTNFIPILTILSLLYHPHNIAALFVLWLFGVVSFFANH
jgi:hypothetical protein